MKSINILRCPFCDGKAKVSFKQGKFFGFNGFGDKKLKYKVQVICNKCHSRGPLYISDWMINPDPRQKKEEFADLISKAIEGWNRRYINNHSQEYD